MSQAPHTSVQQSGFCAGERAGGHQTSLRWWPLTACTSAAPLEPCSSLKMPRKPPGKRRWWGDVFSSLLLLLFFLWVWEEKVKH